MSHTNKGASFANSRVEAGGLAGLNNLWNNILHCKCGTTVFRFYHCLMDIETQSKLCDEMILMEINR